jgi:hypothetical protein
MKKLLNEFIPIKLRHKIINSVYFSKLYANKLAYSSKRIDLCAAQVAHGFHLSKNPSLSGKVCLEIGSGWVLSHALVFHLLGARKVIATDVLHIAHPKVLFKALHSSVPSIIRDILSPFENHSLIRKRLDTLVNIKYFDFNVLAKLNIEYIAPIDFANRCLDQNVDFIFSNSVLEHVPRTDVPLLLRNLNTNLNPGGTMLHYIHLEDHKDVINNPFEFLTIPAQEYPPTLELHRGNRIRKSEWDNYFRQLNNTNSNCIYEWTRKLNMSPSLIDSSINYKDINDLCISNIGVYTKKIL